MEKKHRKLINQYTILISGYYNHYCYYLEKIMYYYLNEYGIYVISLK